MSDITLSAGVRQNLLSLQNTADLMSTTQSRLATGKKVNSALDNPTSFFTSSSLNARASDLSSLLDSMANGIKTIEAADNGLSAITKTLESMQSTLTQARQDKSFESTSYTLDSTAIGTTTAKNLSFSGGSVGSTAVDIALNTTDTTAAVSGSQTGAGTFAAINLDEAGDQVSFDIQVDGGTNTTITIGQTQAAAVGNNDNVIDSVSEFAAAVQNALDAAGLAATADGTGANLAITSDSSGASSSIAITNLAVVAGSTNTFTTAATGLDSLTTVAGADSSGDGGVKTVDELVDAINSNTSLAGNIRASNDNGKLRIENLSTQDLTVTGYDSTSAKVDGGTGTSTIGGNTVRADLASQYNELRDQLDKLADDASYNGINLLAGDNLKIIFNETGTSQISIQAKDGKSVNSANLGIETSLAAADLDSDTGIDGFIDKVKSALGSVRSQASAFGSNLSVVENRNDFTEKMINTLQVGADNLVLADSNEEAANMLALQTRQQLSSTALSLASQADQAVLRLF